jgi:hypothetical protein
MTRQYTVFGRRHDGRHLFRSLMAADEADALQRAQQRWPHVQWQNSETAGSGLLADSVDQFMLYGELGVSHAG